MARNFLNGINLNLTQLLNAVAQILATDPATTEGRFYYHSGRKTLVFHNDAGVVNLGRLDQISAPAAAVALNGQRITGLADGTAATDAATRGQLDAAVLGMDLREEARVASLANGAITTAFQNGSVVDGVTLATGDRILLAGQTAGAENGLYTVNASGAPTRATDFDTAAEAERGVLIPVVEGTSNRGLYLHTTAGAITIGTTALVFFRINPPSGGGTLKFAANVGDGTVTSIAVAHNLGTTDVHVQVRVAAAGGAVVEPDIVITDANTVTVVFAVAPASGQYRVVIVG